MTWRLEAGGWTLKVAAIVLRPGLEARGIEQARPVFVTLTATVRVAPAEAALEVDADLRILEQGPGYARTLYALGDLRNTEVARKTAERLVSLELRGVDPLPGVPWPTPGGDRPTPSY